MKTSHLIPLCAVLLAASVTAGHAQATPGNWCATTPDPPADFPSLAYNASTDAVIAGINQSRAAEGLPALVLPRNYAQLPDEQKVIVLINLERTARRLSPFDSGNPQLSGNDPVLGYAATNHSTLLQHTLALHPGFTNPNGGSVWHDNSIEGTVRQRLGALPGFEGGVSAWSEIIASGSPEGAVYGWMYQDSGSRWGHRHNILGIDACYTSAGAGFARPIDGWSGPCDFSHFPACPWNANRGGTNVYTVEFVRSDGTSTGYKPTVITAATPAPTGQRLVDFQIWLSSQTRADNRGSAVEVRLSATYDATVYGQPNDIRQVWIYPMTTWGQPMTPTACQAGTTCPAILGQLPFGAGAVPCLVTKGSDPSTPSYSCTATVPMPTGSGPPWTGPVVIALDNYGNALYHPAIGVFVPPAACVDPKTGQPFSIDPGTGQFTTSC